MSWPSLDTWPSLELTLLLPSAISFYKKAKMKKIIIILIAALTIFCLHIFPAFAQGHLEFSLHKSSWNINIFESAIESNLGNTLKKYILKEVYKDYPGIEDSNYSQNVDFNSSGGNFGFEIRWYPKGKEGVYSLGVSLEKTTIKTGFSQISTNIELSDGSVYTGNFGGDFIMEPWSVHLSSRWDIIPSMRIHPYITIGLGVAKGTYLENAKISYDFSADLKIDGDVYESYEVSDTRTLLEVKNELKKINESVFLPGFIPFFQLNAGIKGEITNNLYILVDAGIWNGISFRGGIAFRI